MPPRWAGLPGRGTAFFPKESGGKERAGGVPPAPPKTGAHGGGGLCLACKNRACIAARSMGDYVTGAAAPRVARIAVTLQALQRAALYQLGPPGRRRYHASEIPWCLWRLENGASRMPRPTSSAQATDRSLPGKPESSFPPLGLLSPRRPLRWVAAGAPLGASPGAPRQTGDHRSPLRTARRVVAPYGPAVAGASGWMISAPTGLGDFRCLVRAK